MGVGVGVAASTLMPDLLPDLPSAVYGTTQIALAFGVAALIGVLFGSLPAYRSARLAPVEALQEGVRDGPEAESRVPGEQGYGPGPSRKPDSAQELKGVRVPVDLRECPAEASGVSSSRRCALRRLMWGRLESKLRSKIEVKLATSGTRGCRQLSRRTGALLSAQPHSPNVLKKAGLGTACDPLRRPP